MINVFLIASLSILLSVISNTRLALRKNLLSPIVLVNLFVVLYCIVGVYLFWGGKYYFLGKDYSDSLRLTYSLISIFLIFFNAVSILIYVGVKFEANSAGLIDISRMLKGWMVNAYVFVILLVGFFAYVSRSGIESGGVFMVFFNSLIPIIGILALLNVKKYFIYIFAYTFLTMHFGFRYRLILLYLPILFYWVWINRQNLKRQLLSLSALISVSSIVALVGVTRKYSSGLQLDSLAGLNFSEILVQGLFNDTSTVLVTGSFIEHMDVSGEFAYFNQFIYIAEYFIPSGLMNDKSYSPILGFVSATVGDWTSGAAVLGIGEYYHTGGMFGVILFAIIFSGMLTVLFKKCVAYENKYLIYFYFTMSAWFINSFTRGYFPQNTQDLVSLLFGFYVVKIHVSRVKNYH